MILHTFRLHLFGEDEPGALRSAAGVIDLRGLLPAEPSSPKQSATIPQSSPQKRKKTE